jgi:biofilm protein TabA
MILDSLGRFRDYLGVHPLFERVAEFLETTDFAALPEGRHELGEGCFALVSEYQTIAVEEAFIECHRRYVDIQVVISGIEQIGICRREACRSISWNETNDVEVLEGAFDLITLAAGSFAVFLPQDGHMPKLQRGAPAPVRKVVIKVPVAGQHTTIPAVVR